jgi:hypothetical protein
MKFSTIAVSVVALAAPAAAIAAQPALGVAPVSLTEPFYIFDSAE